MTGLLKLALPVLLGIAALAPPASAQSTQPTLSTQSTQSTNSRTAPRGPQPLPALSTKLPNTVHEGGHKYLGRDPDVRS